MSAPQGARSRIRSSSRVNAHVHPSTLPQKGPGDQAREDRAPLSSVFVYFFIFYFSIPHLFTEALGAAVKSTPAFSRVRPGDRAQHGQQRVPAPPLLPDLPARHPSGRRVPAPPPARRGPSQAPLSRGLGSRGSCGSDQLPAPGTKGSLSESQWVCVTTSLGAHGPTCFCSLGRPFRYFRDLLPVRGRLPSACGTSTRSARHVHVSSLLPRLPHSPGTAASMRRPGSASAGSESGRDLLGRAGSVPPPGALWVLSGTL